MKHALFLIGLFLASLASPLILSASADDHEGEGMGVLHTAVNPANNNTYHLLTASSWEDAASYARSLDGFLVTVDDEDENTWLFDTFAGWDNQSRHLWTGLSDHADEGHYRWHDGTPFMYREWGEINLRKAVMNTTCTSPAPTWGTSSPELGTTLKMTRSIFPFTGLLKSVQAQTTPFDSTVNTTMLSLIMTTHWT